MSLMFFIVFSLRNISADIDLNPFHWVLTQQADVTLNFNIYKDVKKMISSDSSKG